MDIVLASNNKHKYEEAKSILSGHNILSLSQVDYYDDILETGSTIQQNALIKVRQVKRYIDKIIIADDTGLFVHALNNEPGVYSARYAGIDATFDDNNKKLMKELKNAKDRSAIFRCAVALSMPGGNEEIFIGEVKGNIAKDYMGQGGFGYDCIFIPDGLCKSYAELSAEEKNKISHRAKALYKLKKYLDNLK